MTVGLVSHGERFNGLSQYLTYESHSALPRADFVVFRNLPFLDGSAHDPPTSWAPKQAIAADIMDTTARQSSRIKYPMKHIILSWHETDKPSPDEMVVAMDKSLAALGYAEHEAMLVGHSDGKGGKLHIHAMLNRVHTDYDRLTQDITRLRQQKRMEERPKAQSDIDHKIDQLVKKRVVNEYKEKFVLRETAMELERKYGWQPTPKRSARSYTAPVKEDARLGDAQDVRYSKPKCDALRQELEYPLRKASSWADLDQMLGRRRIDMRAVGRGIRLTRDGQYAKLSDLLPPKLSVKQLSQKLGNFSDYWQKRQKVKQRRRRKHHHIEAEYEIGVDATD